MKGFLKAFLALITVAIITVMGSIVCFAATPANDSEHGISMSLPDGYVLLNSDTAEDNLDLIESLGYSLSSFKNYLKATGENEPRTLFIGLNPTTKAQIAVKTWSTDFSKRVGDFAFLDDKSLSVSAKELVTTKNSSYKTVSANGMKLIEIRSNAKDSGGEFCSVQYITVCNNNFYSLNFTFSGKIDDGKVGAAWSTLEGFKIKNNLIASNLDFGSILIIVLLFLAIIGAIVFAVVIIISVVKDVKKHRDDPIETSDFIERRK